MLCPHCQAPNTDNARFCDQCGQRLDLNAAALAAPAGSAAPPLAGLAEPALDLTQLAPPQLAAKLEAARAARAMEGERRIVTLLFCDVKGSTAAAERLDPEDWTGIMNGAFEHMIRPIYQYEGTVARLMGDAILAFFGAPITHEDDAERAVLAGLGIVAGMQAYREQVRREWQIDFNVRVGINTGLVVVGAVGSDLRMEYTAMGDAVNLAARMEQTAAAGTVQITGETQRLVAPLFDLEALGGLEVKGKREPVPAFRVLGRKPERGAQRGLQEHGLAAQVIGREAELAAARARLQRLLGHGEGGLLLVLGEAGLGKSRLLAELRREAAGGQALWLEGQSLSFGRNLSYWPIQESLWQWTGLSEQDRAAQGWQRLEEGIGALFPEATAEILPYLANLLNVEVQGEYAERVAYLDAEAMGRQVFLATRRFFERLAQTQPVVLALEDLHWMDASSAQLLEHLLPLTERVPLLVCGLSRLEPGTAGERVRDLGRRGYGGRLTEINLAPLSASDSGQLVSNLLDLDALPPRVRDTIVRKADGNPFFVEEIIRTLIDARAVVREGADGRWVATSQAESFQVPDNIQGVIMARVDRLDEEVKQVLRAAAVIGRTFLHRVLDSVVAGDAALDRHLSALQAIELIRARQQQPEIEYIFKHALAQEATYDSILLKRRRELHARVARALEALFAGRLEEFYGLLAYHYAQAEAWEQAQAYLLKAGDQAGRLAADAEALAHYRQAMQVYARVFGDRWPRVERAALERKIGEALYRRGEHREALASLSQALERLGRPLPTETGAVRRAIVREVLQQVRHRLFPGRLPRPRLGTTAPALAEEIRIYEAVSWIDLVTQPERALLAILRTLNTGEAHGLLDAIVFGYVGVQTVADFLGFYPLGGYYLRLASALSEGVDHPAVRAYPHQGYTMHYSWLGEPGPAIEHGQQGEPLYRRAGLVRQWGAITMLGAETRLYAGDFATARRAAEELIRIGEDGGDKQVWAWGLSTLGPVQRAAGELDEAVRVFKQYLALAEAIPDYISQVTALAELGQCYVLKGDADAALEALRRSLRVSAEHNVRGGRFIGRVYNGLAAAYLLLAERAAGAARADWLRQAGQASRAALGWARSYRPWLAEAQRRQGTLEWLRGREGPARRWWQRSLATAKAVGQPYEAALTQHEAAARQGDTAQEPAGARAEAAPTRRED